MTPEQLHQKAVTEAVQRLGPDLRAVQMAAIEAALAALFASHPNQADAQRQMDLLIALNLSNGFMAGHPDRALVFRDLTRRHFSIKNPPSTD